jgi:hypothetical protein
MTLPHGARSRFIPIGNAPPLQFQAAFDPEVYYGTHVERQIPQVQEDPQASSSRSTTRSRISCSACVSRGIDSKSCRVSTNQSYHLVGGRWTCAPCYGDSRYQNTCDLAQQRDFKPPREQGYRGRPENAEAPRSARSARLAGPQ